jgi:hypothetical protein
MKFFSIKNLSKFQHYNDRCPPWIKLHRSIFEDYEFACLADGPKLHLVLIWLLASQMDNRLPADTAWLKTKLGVKGNINLKPLFDNGFIVMEQVDSKLIADCSNNGTHDGGTEAYKQEAYKQEAETYTEWEREIWFEEDWGTYPRKDGDKKITMGCYLKSVKDPAIRKAFQEKMREYVNSVDKPEFLKHAETFFRTWENLEVSNIRKGGKPINLITPEEQVSNGRGEFVDAVLSAFEQFETPIAVNTPPYTFELVLKHFPKKQEKLVMQVLYDFGVVEKTTTVSGGEC